MSVGSINSSINTSIITASKLDTSKAQVTNTQESNVKILTDSNKTNGLNKGDVPAKTLSLSSDEAKKVGLSTAAKVGITTGGTVAGIVAGGTIGFGLASKLLPNGLASLPTQLIIVAGGAVAGGVIGGVTSNKLANKNIESKDNESKTVNVNTLGTVAKVGITTGGTVAGVVAGGTIGFALASKLLPNGLGSLPKQLLIIGGGALAGGVIGGVTSGVLVNKK